MELISSSDDELTAAVTTTVRENYPGIVIYESSSQKARKAIPYILIVTFALLSIVLLFVRK